MPKENPPGMPTPRVIYQGKASQNKRNEQIEIALPDSSFVLRGWGCLQDVYPFSRSEGKTARGLTGSCIRVEVAEGDSDGCMIGWREVENDNLGGRRKTRRRTVNTYYSRHSKLQRI
jgi:hypothetical protein